MEGGDTGGETGDPSVLAMQAEPAGSPKVDSQRMTPDQRLEPTVRPPQPVAQPAPPPVRRQPQADQPQHSVQQTKIECRQGKLSVTASNASLYQIIQEVTRQAGVELRGSPQELQHAVSVQFSNLPLDRGLKELLTNVDYVIIGDVSNPISARRARLLIFNPAALDDTPTGPQLLGQPAPLGAAPAGVDPALLKEIMSADPALQSHAFQTLATQDPQQAVQALQVAIANGQPAVRLQALQLLDQYNQADPGAVLAAFRSALSDKDTTVKEYAIQALAGRGTSDSVELLRQAFSDPDPEVRLLVLETLAQNPEATDLLQSALSDPDESVRNAAAEVLKGKAQQSQQEPDGPDR
jgi:hypothetical protein